MPKRPLNVYFLYRMDIGSLVDRFARLHKEPIKVGDDLFILLKECCQLIPHFKEGIYTGNAKTLACTRRWDELKAKNPMKLKFFELLEHEYKELYSRMENFVDYHYNPNREYTPPPQLRRAGQQSPVSIDSTPARSRVDTPFDRSYTNTPYPEEEDGYVIPTNQGDANIPIVTSAGFAPSQFTFQPPSYGYNHAGGGFYEGSQYFQSQEAAALATSHYLDAPTPYLSHLAAYQFPPPGAIYPSYPTATNFFVNPASLRGDTPYSGAEFTPSPSVPPEELAERPPTPDMYDTSVYADMRPLDFDEEVAGRRRSSAMFDRLLN
ncbi:hypothetical protein BT69DRAFT_301255 [Atractiella rhizophila]|nr:hypothetical protein BT69DRAFT_301255 [Atractiella rhizophila]